MAGMVPVGGRGILAQIEPTAEPKPKRRVQSGDDLNGIPSVKSLACSGSIIKRSPAFSEMQRSSTRRAQELRRENHGHNKAGTIQVTERCGLSTCPVMTSHHARYPVNSNLNLLFFLTLSRIAIVDFDAEMLRPV